MTVFWGKNGKYYLKAGQSEGSASRPLTNHIGRQSRPFGDIIEKMTSEKGGLLGKEQNERKMASLVIKTNYTVRKIKNEEQNSTF